MSDIEHRVSALEESQREQDRQILGLQNEVEEVKVAQRRMARTDQQLVADIAEINRRYELPKVRWGRRVGCRKARATV